ncbi:hypothetical protein GC194_09740 [bacterium]|nr:hypothetical protein [bacterium]
MRTKNVLLLLVITGLSAAILGSCKKEEIPTLETIAVSAIMSTTAQSGGKITDDGGADISSRGVCWSTVSEPNINNSITTDGGGVGSFASEITGLKPNTTYYIRAYATNSAGTGYGNELSFTTENGQSNGLPTVQTLDVSNIGGTAAR